MKIFLNMVFKGVRRRKKEMRYVSIATFLIVLFVSAVMLFQTMMDRYLMEMNYQNYGDWVLSAVEDYQDSGTSFTSVQHPYLDRSGVCQTGGQLLDEQEKESGISLGTVDDQLLDIGNITLYEGRLPENSDEIVMELSALSALGYSYELGQQIRVAIRQEDEILEKEFCLTGTLKNFTDNWKHVQGYELPGALVTEAGMKEVCEPLYATHFYHLERKYEDLDMSEFSSAFLQAGTARVYNSYVYENRVWGSRKMFQAVELVLLFLGAMALGYLLMSYVSHRRKWYYQFRCMGANQAQIRGMILVETLWGTLTWALAAMALSYAGAAFLSYIVSVKESISWFFRIDSSLFFRQIGMILAVLFFGILCAWAGSIEKSLARNREKITKGQVKRLRRDAIQSFKREKNVVRSYLRRQRKLHPFQRAATILFSVTICFLLVLCSNKIYETIEEYREKKDWIGADYTAEKTEEIRTDLTQMHLYDMYYGMEEQTRKDAGSLLGIQTAEWQIWDNTHVLDWAGKEESPIVRLREKNEENGYTDSMVSTCFHYYQETDSLLKDLEQTYPLELKQLDQDSFRGGEEIILVLFAYEDIFAEDAESVYETTLQAGDTVEIVDGAKETNILSQSGKTSLPGVTSVKIGAVVTDDTLQWNEWKALFGYNTVYGVLASEELAKRVAQADGQSLQMNHVSILLNQNQTFEGTQKRLASIFEKESMTYTSNVEALREARNTAIRNVCLYGVLAVMILCIFLLLEGYFCQIQKQHRERNDHLLRQLGMEDAFLLKLTLREGITTAAWMLMGVPLGFGALWEMFYLANEKEYLGGESSIWSETLGTYTEDPYWVTVDQMKSYVNMGITVALVVGLMAAVVMIHVLSEKNREKKEACDEWKF